MSVVWKLQSSVIRNCRLSGPLSSDSFLVSVGSGSGDRHYEW